MKTGNHAADLSPHMDDAGRLLGAAARQLQSADDLDEIIKNIGNSRVVMLGEASHGTKEFYDWRTLISQRLITEKGFSFIAVEGDWPDCYRYNRYAKGYDTQFASASEAVASYRRWPQWMWANESIVKLIDWLQQYNSKQEQAEKVGFYGLDVYSLWDSLSTTVEYIKQKHPESLKLAEEAYRCFEPYREDPTGYTYDAAWTQTSCQDEVVQMLVELIKSEGNRMHDPEDHFNAQQNAMVVVEAERYYRSLMGGQAESWNIRDHHMMGTLQRLMERYDGGAKAIIWAHNTHIGDARATDMQEAGMINIGQLVREVYGAEKVAAVGFGTYSGAVIASDRWDGQAKAIQVPDARATSWDGLLHESVGSDCYLMLRQLDKYRALKKERLQRAIGVVYDPRREAYGNYVPTKLSERYDVYIYLDKTSALRPLTRQRTDNEVPETFPAGV